VKVWLLPLEPLEERYTSQWYKWFPAEFKKAGLEVEVIDGERLTDRITEGQFLDTCSSYYWEFSQLKQMTYLIKKGVVKNEDIIFSMDIEFPGNVSAIKYLLLKRDMTTRVFGFLHAGSYTKEDFVEFLAPAMKYRELNWLAILDGVFVGSEYHKKAIINRRIKEYASPEDQEYLSRKIHVTGNPWMEKEVGGSISWALQKDVELILPNLPDYRKRPDISLALAVVLGERHPKWRIVVTTSRQEYRTEKDKWIGEFAKALDTYKHIEIKAGLTKEKYYYWLSRSKVMLSTSIEENFGYCPVEAMSFDCCPVLPNRYSYPELVEGNGRLLYDTYDEALEKIESLVENPVQVTQYPKKYEDSIQRMIKIMVGETK